MRLYFTIFIFLSTAAFAAITGTISGRVIDEQNRTALPGTNVMIAGTNMGAAADAEGNFIIEHVPVGSYSVIFNFMGYHQFIQTDVIVRSNRTTVVNAELSSQILEMQTVAVTGGYFVASADQPTSVAGFTSEEIRRSPGSLGDVTRIMEALPSVAPVGDQSNSIVVRGGNPNENAFFVDNIQIPNTTHFPTQGTTGGPIGLLNVDFIEDVDFYSGGFDASYGDRLSSVMDIHFREPERSTALWQLNLDFAGFGGQLEAPLFSDKGGFFIGARQSYLDMLIKNIDLGTSIAPQYGDIQGKAVYDFNASHRLSALLVLGDDQSNADYQTAVDNQMLVYGDQRTVEYTTGLNWRALWSSKAFSQTSLSITSTQFSEDYNRTETRKLFVENHTLEQAVKLRNTNTYIVNKTMELSGGSEVIYEFGKVRNHYGENISPTGMQTPELNSRYNLSDTKAALFASLEIQPFAALKMTGGLRAEYFSLNEKTVYSPRFSASYKVNNRLSLNTSMGIFHQTAPLLLLTQNEANHNLPHIRAEHYIAGISYLTSESTRLTLEVYRKNYDHLPMDPEQPQFSVLDEPFYANGYYSNHPNLNANGRAKSYGVEMMVQKKMTDNFYGMVSASWFRSQYRDLQNVWQDRTFDNRYIMSAEGGFQPNNKWEMSARFLFAGGTPYTPFDNDASQASGVGLLDISRINKKRYSHYQSLNIRIDRRFNFQRTNLVAYVSVWNLLNHKNISAYYWDAKANKSRVMYQWGTLPIFGLAYEF